MLFVSLFGPGCWAPCCFFFGRAFWVCVFYSFLALLGSFLALSAGRRAALFSVGLFGCVFVCVFSSFWAFFGPFLVLGAGRRAALFSVGLFGCVFVFFSFFMKSILSFFDFLAFF